MMLKKFLKNERGATAIEYGLIAAALGLMLVIVMPVIAEAFNGVISYFKVTL